MAGKYEVFIDVDGLWRFRLVAPNGKIIATSEAYKERKSAYKGIQSVKVNAASTSVVVKEG